MDNIKLIEQIKKAAKADEKNRKDIRYKRAMAFLVQKGFLKTNIVFKKYYHTRLNAKDAIWAGKNVEPRILEVLPAAMARFPKAFKLDKTKEALNLEKVANELNAGLNAGDDFLNIPYEKTKVWMNLELNDRRTKIARDKKMTKTFRFKPELINKLEILAAKNKQSETAILEKMIEDFSY